MGRFTVSASSLDVAANAFDALCGCPASLALDTTSFTSDLPDRVVGLDELQRLLLAGASQAARDAVWAEIVRKARRDAKWQLAAVGMALPAIRNVAGSLARGFDGDLEELDAEILAGFLAHLAVVDIEVPGIVTKLRWAAYRAGHAVVIAHRRAAEREEEISEKAGLSSPSGHPDLVLMRAVAAGAISESDAELISATRLGGVDMEAYAAQLGVSYNAVKIRRQRAESRLVAFVTGTPRPRAHEARVRAIRPAQQSAMRRSAELSPAA
ncbi:sigma-70 family RNA polymerase sigma factor [Catenulispora pinisilvae]|uniref:sigma-70 family RNA polymerase sigma factor n=1 Tax=Catenulispora pinisilvae TaxID=2705253 RepID=UPI001891EFE4|nr:sigma-70 family RNA polymerase sigma factor [Catenulispora pinisilvae]